MTSWILNQVNRDRVLREIASLPGPHQITAKPLPARNAEQNEKMWASLTDISNQVIWHGQKYSKEDWKDILTAGLKRQRLVPGIDGGLVLIGSQTSRMSQKDMSELIEFILYFGAEHNVRFGE